LGIINSRFSCRARKPAEHTEAKGEHARRRAYRERGANDQGTERRASFRRKRHAYVWSHQYRFIVGLNWLRGTQFRAGPVWVGQHIEVAQHLVG